MAGGAAEKRLARSSWAVAHHRLGNGGKELCRGAQVESRSETASADQRDPQSPDSQAHGESPPLRQSSWRICGGASPH